MFIIILALIRYMANVSEVSGKQITGFLSEPIYPDIAPEGKILVIPVNASDFVEEVSEPITLSFHTYFTFKNTTTVGI